MTPTESKECVSENKTYKKSDYDDIEVFLDRYYLQGESHVAGYSLTVNCGKKTKQEAEVLKAQIITEHQIVERLKDIALEFDDSGSCDSSCRMLIGYLLGDPTIKEKPSRVSHYYHILQLEKILNEARQNDRNNGIRTNII